MFTKAWIEKKKSQKEAEIELNRLGVSVLAVEEDASGVCFWLEGKIDCSPFSFIAKQESVSSEIDWEEQWRSFSPCFRDGLFHLDLSAWGIHEILRLHPGPGFGDLSHATTQLMIQMMLQEKMKLKRRQVVDIGSGSGVLALTAALMGAKNAIGIDIDIEANRHARKNAKMNQLPVRFFSPGSKTSSFFRSAGMVLINMIFEEQKEALASHQMIPEGAFLLSSGILKEQKSSYIHWMQERGFKLLEAFQEGEWLGLIFRKKRPSRKDNSSL